MGELVDLKRLGHCFFLSSRNTEKATASLQTYLLLMPRHRTHPHKHEQQRQQQQPISFRLGFAWLLRRVGRSEAGCAVWCCALLAGRGEANAKRRWLPVPSLCFSLRITIITLYIAQWYCRGRNDPPIGLGLVCRRAGRAARQDDAS